MYKGVKYTGKIVGFMNYNNFITILLKPQDSFGRFVLKNSRSSESGPYHQKAPLNLPAIVLNDML